MVPLILLGVGAARLVAPTAAKFLIKQGLAKKAPKGAETVGKKITKVEDLPPMVIRKFQQQTAKPKPPTKPKPSTKIKTKPKSDSPLSASQIKRMKAEGKTEKEIQRIGQTAAKFKKAEDARIKKMLSQPKVKKSDAPKTTLQQRTKKTREQVAAAKQKRKAEFKKQNPQRTKLPVERKISVEKQAKELSGIASESAKKLKDATQMQGKVSKVPAGQKGMRLPGKGETVKRQKGGKVIKKNMSGDDLVRSCYD
jgi:hypothetical protein|tara:strand:+ start:68 stop:826 length:759 start_codon:yes stop_codon:yes gene_type:complete